MLVRLNMYAILKKPLSLANKINLEQKRYVSAEAGRVARCPVRPESIRSEYEVVSRPSLFLLDLRIKRKKSSSRFFSDRSNDESDTNKQAKKLCEYSSF